MNIEDRESPIVTRAGLLVTPVGSTQPLLLRHRRRRIAYDLRHAGSDGTRQVVFEPLNFLGSLAALVPPPRAHQRDIPWRAGPRRRAALTDRAGSPTAPRSLPDGGWAASRRYA